MKTKPYFLAILLLFSFLKSSLLVAQNPYRIANFASKYVLARNIDIWLPKNYDPNGKKKYSVLYMHDGQNLFDAKNSYGGQEWGIDETIQKLLDEKKIQDCIVVGVWNSPKRFFEYVPQKAMQNISQKDLDAIAAIRLKGENNPKIEFLADNYLRFLVEELKPYIDKNYKTKTDRKHTFVAGSSMGGLISMYAISEYPQIFGGAACVSTHWSVLFDNDHEVLSQSVRNYMQQNFPKAGKHRIYFDFGTTTLDSLYEPHQQKVDAIIKNKGYRLNKDWLTVKAQGAAHNEADWRKRFDQIAIFLLKK